MTIADEALLLGALRQLRELEKSLEKRAKQFHGESFARADVTRQWRSAEKLTAHCAKVHKMLAGQGRLRR